MSERPHVDVPMTQETEEGMDDGKKRTVLPDGEAEGAANFAAEPAMDPTAGAPADNAATVMEQGFPAGGSGYQPESSGREFVARDELGQDPQEILEEQTDELDVQEDAR